MCIYIIHLKLLKASEDKVQYKHITIQLIGFQMIPTE